MPFIPIIIIILVVVLILVLATNLKVVQQSKAYVIERLGAFHSVWGVGIHFKVPFLERVAKVVSLEGAGGGLPAPARHHQGQRHHADRHGSLLPDHRP